MTDQDVKEKIQAWLREEGLSVTENTQPADTFRFVVNDPTIKTEIFQPGVGADKVVILIVVAPGPDHAKRINAMEGKARNEFLWEIRMSLLDSGIQFHFVTMPLDKVTVYDELFFDGLTKDTFMQRWHRVRIAAVKFIWIIQQKLGDAAPLGFKMPGGPVN